MAIFKEISSADIKTARSYLNQLIDVIQQDVSGSSTRRQYQAFVTGGVGPGVTSSLFQTIYDQDFSLQTANAIFDVTVGVFRSGSIVNNSKTGQDAAGKLLFQSSSMMMREKIDVYSQFAQTLLGSNTSQFAAPFDSTNASDLIDPAMFVCFKRLFARDNLKRETFAMRFLSSASATSPNLTTALSSGESNYTNGTAIFTDIGSANNQNFVFGGEVGSIVNAQNTAQVVGLLFYDRGIAVFDLNKILIPGQAVQGIISAMNSVGGTTFSPGQTPIGAAFGGGAHGENPNATFVPDLMVSASVDDIVDHLCSVRFDNGAQTAITFQNVTNINSTLVFCRAEADEFNYSSNPTFIDANSRIVVIDPGQEDTQQTFTYVTSIGLYDANDNLLAVGKLSRPVQKSPERDITFRLRIDF